MKKNPREIKVQFNVNLPHYIKEVIKEEAYEQRVSQSKLVEEAVRAYCFNAVSDAEKEIRDEDRAAVLETREMTR